MNIYLHNTLSRQKEIFKPLKDKKVGLYTCGPTVYWYAHIGNLRTYVFEDILRRVLEYNDYEVQHIMNITDIGHLSSDADEGEDKIVKAAIKEGKTAQEIADFYTTAFKEDIKKLNILEPNIYCKATEHIEEQIELIKNLERQGFTYQAGGNIYFDVSKSKDYGKLANINLNAPQKTRVTADPNKKNPHDFVLWFTKSKFQNQEMKWSSPWGAGYPGWHIECSAMAMKYLGETIDIHCGGIDHIGVHHTNEIAQSEAATGKIFANYWLHSEFLLLNHGKMAKSAGTIFTLNDIIQKKINPLALRYLFFTAHYRSPLNFSWESLEAAQNALNNLYENFKKLDSVATHKEESATAKKDSEIITGYKEKFLTIINDDLNMPEALALTWQIIKDKKLTNNDKNQLMLDFDKIFGLGLNELKKAAIKIPAEIKKMIQLREKARQEKNWREADKIRREIENNGYMIEDTNRGPKISI